MKKYKCIKSFLVPEYDGDCFETGKTIKIKVGQTYELDESGSTYLSADIHLDCEDGSWLEIGRETLEECFKEVDLDE